jgi:hypothetical protein
MHMGSSGNPAAGADISKTATLRFELVTSPNVSAASLAVTHGVGK